MSSVTPAPEIIELETEGFLCESAGTTGGSDDIPAEKIDDGFFD